MRLLRVMSSAGWFRLSQLQEYRSLDDPLPPSRVVGRTSSAFCTMFITGWSLMYVCTGGSICRMMTGRTRLFWLMSSSPLQPKEEPQRPHIRLAASTSGAFASWECSSSFQWEGWAPALQSAICLSSALCGCGLHSMQSVSSSVHNAAASIRALGFAYVSKVTERRPWFLSRFGNYSEFIKVVAIAPVIWLVGPLHTIRPPGQRLDFDVMRDYAVYNGLYYILPFFLGLNWTHLQRWKPLRGVSASPAGVSK